MIVIAIGSHMIPPPSHRGIKPKDVVKVVKSIGRKRWLAASTIASAGFLPYSSSSISIRSSKTIALLMTIQDKDMTPKKAVKPKEAPVIKKPRMTPINPKGIVNKIMAGLRIELN